MLPNLSLFCDSEGKRKRVFEYIYCLFGDAFSFVCLFLLELFLFPLVEAIRFNVQEIIRKYTGNSGSGNKHAALASALGALTWEKPLYNEFQQLARYLKFSMCMT